MSKILVVDDDRTTRHLIGRILTSAGFSATVAKDGMDALKLLRNRRFDLMLLDVWMPRMNGLELLERLHTRKTRRPPPRLRPGSPKRQGREGSPKRQRREGGPRVVVMTSDDAPETLLKAVRRQAFQYVHKPVDPPALLQTVREVLKAPDSLPIEVVSARPEWVELVVPCTREAAERIQAVMTQLDTGLAPKLRETMAYAFRELLLNAIEWGGRLDPSRKVRISYLRARRMLMYRIADPGPGFDLEKLPHAAIGQPADVPIAHMQVREEKGIRPGGFGLLMVRASVDELLYNEKRNEVVFVKYLDDGAAPGKTD